MLAPHHRKNSQLGEIRFATKNFFDAFEFFRSQSVLGHQVRGNDWTPKAFASWIDRRTWHRRNHVSESADALNGSISLEYKNEEMSQSMKHRMPMRHRLEMEPRRGNKQTEGTMKNKMITLACALIAPVAFAQTSTTTTEQTTTTAPTTTTETTTSTTYSAGTVTTYEPGKTIVVKSTEGPVSFALSAPVRIVNAAGNVVKAITPGQKVKVYYTGPTEKRVVERVIVED